MASPTRSALAWRVFTLVASLALLLAVPARALRVVDYNVLNYPGSSGPARAPYYRTILAPLNADAIVTGEMASPTSVTEFLSEVLDVMEPGQWAAATFVDGNDTDAGFFYKPAKVQFLDQTSFYPDAPANLRLVHVYHVRPAGYTAAAADLWIYAMHLKASDTSADEFKRYTEAIGVRSQMEANLPAGAHALILGDMNFYRSSDRGYQKFIQDTLSNIGRAYDLLPAGTWHDGASFAAIHTQSPCKDGTCASGAATGGLDDRFDFILPTYSMGTGQGLGVITGTCIPVGNDGLHLNLNITDSPTIPEGATYATALKLASDHLPVRIDLRLPAKITTDAALAFGSVIVGAPTQSQNLTVNNPAVAPADSLNCTFAAPAGFGGPGPLAVVAGGSALTTVTMSTASSGAKSGNLTISSDAPDNPTTYVSLSGTVLEHANPSLDSLTVATADTLDFGDQAKSSFADRISRIFNHGYGPLQARLSVNDGVIAGGGSHFSIVGGFQSALVAGTSAHYTVHFDTAGVTLDSTYYATLTFTSADEPLPGAQPRPNLVVTLRARPIHTQSAPRLSAASQLDFGTVILGAAAQQALAISNGATPPADSLHYSFGAPAGFTAPPGTFAQAAGDPATDQPIGMSTASAGSRSGTLIITSNDPDSSSKNVLLSGAVLLHAQASLDSLTAVAEDTLDFGHHAAGDFATLLAAVHDRGYDALRARLSVSAAQITGGDGLFSLLGFSPVLVAGTAARWEVHFDDAGATADSTYEATLTFTSADEPLPGAAAQPDVHYLLSARVAADTIVAVEPALPALTRLYAPMPNPLTSGSTLRFDLARMTSARLEVFDLSGRRVALLADREFTPGRYDLRWDGRGETAGPLGSGLYFVRLTTRGLPPQTVRLAVVR